MHSRLSIHVCVSCMYVYVCVCACLPQRRPACWCACVRLIHLNQVQCSHFLSPSTLSVAAGDKNHLRWSKMTENNGEISSASFWPPPPQSLPIYSTPLRVSFIGPYTSQHTPSSFILLRFYFAHSNFSFSDRLRHPI